MTQAATKSQLPNQLHHPGIPGVALSDAPHCVEFTKEIAITQLLDPLSKSNLKIEYGEEGGFMKRFIYSFIKRAIVALSESTASKGKRCASKKASK